LECYLPEGHRSNNIKKLIELVNFNDFWERLPAENRTEITTIVDALLASALEKNCSAAL
jgi:hypothetical protein